MSYAVMARGATMSAAVAAVVVALIGEVRRALAALVVDVYFD